MKYIRVADGIYECVNPDNTLKVGDFVFEDNKPILLMANTIQELCDKFIVLEYGLGGNVLYSREEYNTFEEAVAGQTSKHKCWYEIYGAIWTDKGLIYIAKMNEKEELDLC